ncbi:uncharacterized protein LOC130012329 [Patella vulgata]|uniref:uncharacterized protein LOC130012329 n=1 Tax=Patella vulgata TaxID=6465 RepID=UPI0024A7EF81|nr:uncharacterized protein LOC130012329 [Patella vulgata]
MMTNRLSTQNTLLTSLTQNKPLLSSSLLSSGSTSSGSTQNEKDARKRKSQVTFDSETKKVREISKLSDTFGTNLRLTSLNLGTSLLTSGLSLTSSLTTGSLLGSQSQSGNLRSTYLNSVSKDTSNESSKIGLVHDIRSKLKDQSIKSPVTKRKENALTKLSPESRKVVKKKEKKSDRIKHEVAVKYYSIEYPQYNLQRDSVVTEIHLPKFLPPKKDRNLLGNIHRPLQDVNGLKLGLINAVSASLISQPNFKNAKDQTRLDLTRFTEKVISYDAEFVLKVALYTRKELNIRTTSNFLLALAAKVSSCRPYLKKYFSIAINLPSDWIEVAEIYQAFHDADINFRSLPACLRRVMIAKFPDFDKYQLAKYNKDSSKNKNKKEKQGSFRGRGRGRGGGRGRGRGGRGGVTIASTAKPSDSDSDSDDEEKK